MLEQSIRRLLMILGDCLCVGEVRVDSLDLGSMRMSQRQYMSIRFQIKLILWLVGKHIL